MSLCILVSMIYHIPMNLVPLIGFNYPYKERLHHLHRNAKADIEKVLVKMLEIPSPPWWDTFTTLMRYLHLLGERERCQLYSILMVQVQVNIMTVREIFSDIFRKYILNSFEYPLNLCEKLTGKILSYSLDIHQTVKTCVKIYNSNSTNVGAHLNS